MRLGDLCGSETERLTPTDDLIIDYIDISSVSNETKSIIGKQTLQSTEAPSRAQRVLKPNDILVSTVRPNLNAVAVYDGTFENLAVASTGFCVLRCKPGVDHRFVFNVCKSKAFIKAMTEQATGASYPAVNDKIIRAFEVPDLSFDCQEQLTARLDTIQRVIDQRKCQLLALDTLIKARFAEMFGDLVIGDKVTGNKHRIGEFASVTKLAGFEFTKFIQYQESGEIIMLRGLNCKSGKLILDDVRWISKETSDLLPRSKLYNGDILITYAGTIGDVAMVDADDRYHLAPNVGKITIEDKEHFNPVFLMHLLMYSHDYIMTFASQVAQASINMEKIRNFEYYFPEVEEQRAFAAFVSRVDKSKVAIQVALDKTQLLFDSLMQKYFG